MFSIYVLQSDASFIEQIRDGGDGATHSRMSAQIRETVVCRCHRRSEQRAIAEALSDVDALIGALDQLIAKKRDLKQAAMQQLLTGKTRLPASTASGR